MSVIAECILIVHQRGNPLVGTFPPSWWCELYGVVHNYAFGDPEARLTLFTAAAESLIQGMAFEACRNDVEVQSYDLIVEDGDECAAELRLRLTKDGNKVIVSKASSGYTPDLTIRVRVLRYYDLPRVQVQLPVKEGTVGAPSRTSSSLPLHC